MALNDKLINYGNLSTFYDKLQETKLNASTGISIDASNYISVDSSLLSYIESLEQRIYALEHPTTVL